MTFCIVGFASSGMQYLKFTTDYKIFFKKDNPNLIALEKLQKTYVKSENVLITIAPQDGDVFTQENLNRVERLTELCWQTPYVIRVDSITNFQHSYGKDNELVVEDLVADALSLTDEQVQKIKSIALNEPLLKKLLISPDAKVTGINITVEFPGLDEQKETPEVATFVRHLIAEFQKEKPNLDFYLTGGVMMNNAFPEASQRDIEILTPIMYVIVFLGLAVFFKSISITLICVTVIFFSILGALGMAGWLGIKLSPPSATAPNIILTIAVADCVHFVTAYLEEMRKGWIRTHSWRMQRKESIKESLRINIQPVFLTSLTTALGFLSLNFSESPPFHDLGNIVAIGVLLAFLLTIFFLPSITYIMPVRIRPLKTDNVKRFEWLGGFIVANRKICLVASVLLTLFLAALLPFNKLDDEPLKYFDTENTFRKHTEFTTSNLTGIYEIHYAISSGAEGGISQPDYLDFLDRFVSWLEAQPEVLHVYSVSDIFKRLNKNLHNDDDRFYRMPKTQALAAQYFLLYELSLPMGMDLNDRVNLDKSATRVSTRIKNLSSYEILDLEKRTQDWMRKNLPEEMISPGTGGNIIFANIGIKNIQGMLQGTLIAFILISIVIMIALRSIPLGLLSLVPNLVPSIMAFGLWGLIDGEINMGVAAVTGLTLGIVVDDSIHFLSKYLDAYRNKKMDPVQCVHYAFSNVGKAMWITSAVLIAGFMVLTLSDFAINAKLGLLTAITIAFALVADFSLLPSLLMLSKNRTTR